MWLCAGCASPAAVSTAVTSAASSEELRLSVIGDSFTAGSDNDIVWPEILADRHAASLQNAGAGGAGYVAGADLAGTFADQIPDAVSTNPDVVLVVGSENDVDEDPAEVADEADALFATLADEAPTARVVVIGPIWSGDDLPAELYDVDAALADAAASAGLAYVGTLDDGWLADPDLLQDDGDHPTDDGQYALADAVEAALDRVDRHLLG